MADMIAPSVLQLVGGRRGHFRLESGYHGGLWLDLDGLFMNPGRLDPLVQRLADRLAVHTPAAICGPLLGGAFLAQRVAQLLGTEFWFTRPAAPEERSGLFRARYALPRGFAQCAVGRRVALVDDVMSAGSSLRATFDELRGHGAVPVAVGTLLVMGDVGARYFAEQRLSVEALGHEPYEMWTPEACPRCVAGEPLEDVSVAAT